jgi:hypothetical protein
MIEVANEGGLLYRTQLAETVFRIDLPGGIQ